MDDPIRKATVRAEATLLRIPLFGLAVKGAGQLDGIEFRFHRRRGDQSLEAVIRTERDDKTPYPGPLSRRVHMAVLSLVADQGFPVSNPVTWTWRDLCRRMGLPNSGRRIGELKSALRSTWGLKIFGLEAITPTRSRETWRRTVLRMRVPSRPPIRRHPRRRQSALAGPLVSQQPERAARRSGRLQPLEDSGSRRSGGQPAL